MDGTFRLSMMLQSLVLKASVSKYMENVPNSLKKSTHQCQVIFLLYITMFEIEVIFWYFQD